MSARLGFLLLVASVFLNAATYHLQRLALDLGATKAMAVLGNCYLGVLYFLLGGLLWRRMGWSAWGMQRVTPRAMLRWLGQRPLTVILASGLGGAAAYLIIISINRFGSEVTSFLANQTLVFMVLGGLLFGERLRLIEAAVMLAILLGALLFSYQGGELRLQAFWLMAAACFGVAGKQLIIRRAADTAPLCLVMAAMLLSMGLLNTVIGAWAGELALIPWRATLVLATSTFVGSFLGMLLLYAGYGMVGVCRGAPLDAMRPLAVLLIGLGMGHALPTAVQSCGAALVLGGTALLARLHRPGPTPTAGATVTAPAAARGV